MRDDETRLKRDRKWTGGVRRSKGGGVFTSSEIIRAGHGAACDSGSRGGAITGGAPPPQGSEFVGDVGDAIPQGSVGSAPHGPDAARERALGGGDGPAEQAAPAPAVAPQGSAAPSSIRAPYRSGASLLNTTFILPFYKEKTPKQTHPRGDGHLCYSDQLCSGATPARGRPPQIGSPLTGCPPGWELRELRRLGQKQRSICVEERLH
ncbi:hypothetical protein EYF80_008756 [Liparis tanakae]|uniref:Uncharacterized protein n=1 Tax=Liparis tanakae TaxID=230148 RepID=A0A4Z2ISY9_9TELE|nr:hypothetical protein EYF80_008756 [Liparis tanakae]